MRKKRVFYGKADPFPYGTMDILIASLNIQKNLGIRKCHLFPILLKSQLIKFCHNPSRLCQRVLFIINQLKKKDFFHLFLLPKHQCCPTKSPPSSTQSWLDNQSFAIAIAIAHLKLCG